MIERGDRFGLALEPFECLGRDGARRKDFDRDLPIETRVAGAIDLAHAARAERGEDLVRAKPGSGVERHGVEFVPPDLPTAYRLLLWSQSYDRRSLQDVDRPVGRLPDFADALLLIGQQLFLGRRRARH